MYVDLGIRNIYGDKTQNGNDKQYNKSVQKSNKQ